MENELHQISDHSACAAQIDLRRVRTNPDFWYPVAWSRELGREKAIDVRFAGRHIVVVRLKSGVPYALDGLCAHRQVLLGKGNVHGDLISCVAHGLRYNRDGQCVSPNVFLPKRNVCASGPGPVGKKMSSFLFSWGISLLRTRLRSLSFQG